MSEQGVRAWGVEHYGNFRSAHWTEDQAKKYADYDDAIVPGRFIPDEVRPVRVIEEPVQEHPMAEAGRRIAAAGKNLTDYAKKSVAPQAEPAQCDWAVTHYHVVDGLGGEWLAEQDRDELVGIGRVDDILKEATEQQQAREAAERSVDEWKREADKINDDFLRVRDRADRLQEFLVSLLPNGADGDTSTLSTEVRNYVDRLKASRDTNRDTCEALNADNERLREERKAQRDRADRLERELGLIRWEREQVTELEAELAQARDTIEKVRELHRVDTDGYDEKVCVGCAEEAPCSTLEILDAASRQEGNDDD